MAVDMFMKIDKVEGESKDSKHAKEVDVLSWSWGMSQSGSMHSGGGGGSGKVSVNDLTFTKYVDVASHLLLQCCATGKHLTNAVLTVRKAGEKQQEYLKIHLEEVLVSSVTTGGSGGEDRLTENVTLNFAKFKFEYSPQKADGSLDSAKTTGYDVRANTKWG